VETDDENATALVVREQQCNMQHAVFVRKVWERREEDVASLFSEGVGPRTIFIESLPNKQSSCSFLRDNKGAIYEFQL